jgi:hypothetical protein
MRQPGLVDPVCPDLGAEWLARRIAEAFTHRRVAELEKLGHTSVLDPGARPAAIPGRAAGSARPR